MKFFTTFIESDSPNAKIITTFSHNSNSSAKSLSSITIFYSPLTINGATNSIVIPLFRFMLPWMISTQGLVATFIFTSDWTTSFGIGVLLVSSGFPFHQLVPLRESLVRRLCVLYLSVPLFFGVLSPWFLVGRRAVLLWSSKP